MKSRNIILMILVAIGLSACSSDQRINLNAPNLDELCPNNTSCEYDAMIAIAPFFFLPGDRENLGFRCYKFVFGCNYSNAWIPAASEWKLDYSLSSSGTDPTVFECSYERSYDVYRTTHDTQIDLTCSRTAFLISGYVESLPDIGDVVLQNNGVDDLTVSGDIFRFSTPLKPPAPYSITILREPEGFDCTLSNASGVINDLDVSDVVLNCQKTVDPEVPEVIPQ